MTPPEMPNQNPGESSSSQPINEERYWRVQANLGRLMRFMDIRIEGSEIFSELAASHPGQGAIIAPTHTSWLDIIALGVTNDEQPLRFLGKGELWRLPYIGNLARDVGAFSVDRSDQDSRRGALETSVDLVNQGEWVVIYPEGTRNRSPDRRSIGEVKSTGVARVALQAEGITPIVLVGVGYREGILRRKASPRHMGVVIGEPIYIDQADVTAENVQTIMTHLVSGLARLKIEAVDLAESY